LAYAKIGPGNNVFRSLQKVKKLLGTPIPGTPTQMWLDTAGILAPLLANDPGQNKAITQWLSLTFPLTLQTMADFCAAAQPVCDLIELEDMQTGNYLQIYQSCAWAQFWYENCED
jgi:hypothetical protein